MAISSLDSLLQTLNSSSTNGKILKESDWRKNIQALIEYKAKHGTTRVKPDHPLAGWSDNVRERWNRGILPQSKIRVLQSIGFDRAIKKK